jgi:hypothetical protein
LRTRFTSPFVHFFIRVGARKVVPAAADHTSNTTLFLQTQTVSTLFICLYEEHTSPTPPSTAILEHIHQNCIDFSNTIILDRTSSYLDRLVKEAIGI